MPKHQCRLGGFHGLGDRDCFILSKEQFRQACEGNKCLILEETFGSHHTLALIDPPGSLRYNQVTYMRIEFMG